jgi:hypothetical protein
MKFGLPRSDLSVTASGIKIQPALALGGWVAFSQPNASALVMGDLVLTEDEVTPVMTKLEQSGIEITALHNHLLHESPRVMYMHIGAHGDPVQIASQIAAAIALTKIPPVKPPAAAAAALALDQKRVEQILGRAGKVNGGVLQFTVPRAEAIEEHGSRLPRSMGISTAINFQPTGDGKAAITGDFVLLANEVNPVIAALRSGNIEITALHSHMLQEQPRLFFMHFWANDDAVKLAQALRSAIEKTNSNRP